MSQSVVKQISKTGPQVCHFDTAINIVPEISRQHNKSFANWRILLWLKAGLKVFKIEVDFERANQGGDAPWASTALRPQVSERLNCNSDTTN